VTHAAALARFAADLELDKLPPEVLDRARLVASDTLGVMSAGARHPFLVALRAELASGNGLASVVGTGARAAPGIAALLNAAACTALQADEGHRETGSHPAIHVLPAALAVGEVTGAEGDEVLRALVGGYEVAIRVGLELGGSPLELHTHGNWPVVGAAIAAGMVLRLGPETLEQLIDAAAMLCVHAPVRTAIDGFTAHHYLAGLGAQTAVTLALGARARMTSSAGGLDHLAAVRQRTTPLREPEDWEILRNYFKLEPLCAHTLTAVDAVASLLPLRSSVERITVATYAAAAQLASTTPPTDLAARFSLPYAVAARLLAPPDRSVLSATAGFDEPAVRALMSRVDVIHDPTMDAGYPHGRPCHVRIDLASGPPAVATRTLPRGDADNPATAAELEAKFLELTGAAPLPPLDQHGSLADLVAHLVGP
jgi:2-methylcitrate dehydratase PrpD